MFFDSHAHYDDKRFEDDREALLKSMPKEGITGILNCGADMKSSRESVRLAEQYDYVYAAVGVHPHDAKSMTDQNMEELSKLLDHKKVVALGEIGLDYYYDHSPRELQKIAFAAQIDLAVSKQMPIIVHDRDAHGDCMDIVRSKKGVFGVFHCFSGSLEMAKELLKLGFYLSFGGPVTFKNAKGILEVVKYVPKHRFLIETDCPYLAPEPHRGERNCSLFVKDTARRIAQLRGTTTEEIARLSLENTKQLFQI